VALAFFAAEHFACGSQLEPFGDGFPGFGDACVFGHRGREGRGFSQTCKSFLVGFFEVAVVRGQVRVLDGVDAGAVAGSGFSLF
jgi:hypothetical protein